MKKALAGNIAAVSAIIFLSTYSAFSKILLEHLSAPTLAAIAQTFSVVTLLLFFGALPEFKRIHKLPPKEILILFIISILSAVAAPLLLLKGLQTTTAMNSALIGRLEPVLAGVISAFWLGEKVTKHQIFGTLIMFSGLYFIVTKGMSASLGFEGGDFFIMLAAFSWAAATNIFKKYLHHIRPELMVLFRNIVGALILFFVVPYLFDFKHDLTPLLDGSVLKTVIFFSFVVIIAAQFLWYKALEMIPATKASGISLISPVFGVLFAILILGEAPAMYHLYGGVLIVFGLILTVYHHQKHPHHHIHEKVKHWTH